jgi:hypothetical protein
MKRSAKFARKVRCYTYSASVVVMSSSPISRTAGFTSAGGETLGEKRKARMRRGDPSLMTCRAYYMGLIKCFTRPESCTTEEISWVEEYSVSIENHSVLTARGLCGHLRLTWTLSVPSQLQSQGKVAGTAFRGRLKHPDNDLKRGTWGEHWKEIGFQWRGNTPRMRTCTRADSSQSNAGAQGSALRAHQRGIWSWSSMRCDAMQHVEMSTILC